MSTSARVGAFVLTLVVLFALAVVAGRAVDSDEDGGERAANHEEHEVTTAAGHGAAHGSTAPAGLAIAQDGYRLVADTTTLEPGRPQTLSYRIVGPDGATVREFAVEQGKRMHLLVVRRDLHGFQHLHPSQSADGGWSIALTLAQAGVHRAFADFETGGERRTLGVDLLAAGDFQPVALPAPSTLARTAGYEVRLAEHGAQLHFTVSRNGRPVDDLQPYLGARGHLVVLRAGDLAYEHVHPLPGDELVFEGGEPEPGTYRLFVQFRHEGAVRTAEFTREVQQ